MSFLKNLMSSKGKKLPEGWKQLNQESQLDQIAKDSFQKPVVLFKHSVRCGISLMAKERLESQWDFKSDELDFYYLDLLAFRPISNKIAEQFGVIHQSPQIILLKDGKVTYNISHHQINVKGLRASL